MIEWQADWLCAGCVSRGLRPIIALSYVTNGDERRREKSLSSAPNGGYGARLRACSPSSPGGRSHQAEHPRSEQQRVLTTVLATLAAAWGVVMACAPTLQIARMRRSRSSAGVSLAYFAVLIPGFGLWLAYGVASANPVLIVPNAAALLAHLITATLAYRLRPQVTAARPALLEPPAPAPGQEGRP